MKHVHVKKDDLSKLLKGLSCALALTLVTGCTNFRNRSTKMTALVPSAAGDSSSLYQITQATVAATSSSSTGASASTTTPPEFTLSFDTSKAPQPLTNVCNGYTGSSTDNASLRCQCTFSWSDTTAQGNSNISIPHYVVTDVTQVQPGLVVCQAPSIYADEIFDGTSIVIGVIPGPGNTNTFGKPTYNFIKNGASAQGSFRDFQGRSFMNIARYTCYDSRKRGTTIQNFMQSLTNPNSGNDTKYIAAATKFCFKGVNSNSTNSSSADNCPNLPLADFTAQSNYYNLYIRETESGDINPTNYNYSCPTVLEPLNSGTAGAAQLRPWPLDTTFALSLGRTGDFPIGVVANTKLANSNDPANVSTDCDGTTSASNGGINSGCLGFAALPAADGSCPLMTDASGKSVPTYRLRRFVALLPQIFDTNGDYVNEPLPIDTIYVLDRPVQGPNGSIFTMEGPKPCPASYFYKNTNTPEVTNGYRATNDAFWEGRNVDGIHLPETDTANSCSAALPLLSADRSTLYITTVNTLNANPAHRRIYVRPIHAWAPHYEEDTNFKACAPLANPLRDAPLHFAQKDGSTPVAWCAEAYPTQNDNVGTIAGTDGNVKTFTSHIVSNSTSAACAATLPPPNAFPAFYPLNGFAHHQAAPYAGNSCDRTVVNSNALGNTRFPLLAPPSDVENALTSDPSYGCTVTWDNGGAKSGKASPAGGCCGAAVAGLPAHLEPNPDGSSACAVPAY